MIVSPDFGFTIGSPGKARLLARLLANGVRSSKRQHPAGSIQYRRKRWAGFLTGLGGPQNVKPNLASQPDFIPVKTASCDLGEGLVKSLAHMGYMKPVSMSRIKKHTRGGTTWSIH